ncbi:AMP-binding protein [Saccharomonospora iraqiensis]|uniref:AMP-binding protein n=1 Tax=Saccharomonospora iraqiensis TaxID=52698 RepID=UPI0004111412|nr:AMP-binding protein [Saccharomonospora iraqiensis]
MTGEDSNVADLVASAARARPDHAALIDTATHTTLTWRAVDRAVDALATRIAATGVGPGDRVALRLPTSARFAVAFFAILRADAIAVPLNPQAPPGETTPVFDHSGARLLIADRALGTGDEPKLLVPDPDPAPQPESEPESGAALARGTSRGGEDIAAIFYTSGTAGPARGAMLSHRALLANVRQLHALDPPATLPDDRVFVAIPLHHIYGLGPGLLSAAAAGATTVLAPRFELGQALADLTAYGVSAMVGVPAMYAALAEQPPERIRESVSALRLMVSGAAALHPRVLAAIRSATGQGVYEGYGLTETAPVVTSTLRTGYPKPGSVGRPLPGVEVRLVDSDGDPLPVPLDPDDPDDAFDTDADGTGLVAVRGDNLFSGYWPDGAYGPDAEGWFRTGDVGYIDVDGDLHLVDRATDVVIVNGFNVYPHEVEEVIGAMPQVAEVAVVGMLDERTGEAVKAVVVPAAGAGLSAQRVQEHCAEHLAGYKVPRTVDLVTELPHSPTGKVRRAELRSSGGVPGDTAGDTAGGTAGDTVGADAGEDGGHG